MIERKRYLSQLIASRGNGFPKVITGVRRCGKSYLLKEIYKRYLLQNGVSETNILLIELDDLRNASLRNPIELDRYVRSRCDPSSMNYVFIDEIQLVPTIVNPLYTEGKYVLAKKEDKEVLSFVDVVLGLSRESSIDLYVTGSNSKMLSSDIVTEFRDKATNISLTPLSLEEFVGYKGDSSSDTLFEYLRYGGMPLAVLKSGSEKTNYLKNLFQVTYFRDILDRNKLQKNGALDSLCNILAEETGQFINAERLSNIYQSKEKTPIDKMTVEKYINAFADAFLLQEVKRFDIKGNREIGALKKYYFIDNGLRNARLNFAYEDEGQMLETTVYNELFYAGYSVNVGALEKYEKDHEGKSVRKTYEIDFIARRGPKKYYIQVGSDIATKETRFRELRPFLAVNDSFQKILVINKPLEESVDSNGFITIGMADFLLRFIR